jgi:hypothetical protein
MWHDNETVDDLLGFRIHADVIKTVITDQRLLPITIGLFGDWGSGKTSIMKMLHADLDTFQSPSGKEVVCIYFNSWLFEGYDDAKSAILSSILLQLAEHKRIGPQIKEKASQLLKSVDWMRLGRFAFNNVAFPALMAYLTGGASVLPSVAGMIIGSSANTETPTIALPDPNESAPANNATSLGKTVDTFALADAIKVNPARECVVDVKEFRKRFSDMLSDSNIGNLVVMIDDLDRCSPKRIVENLEAIKLFLNVEQTAFVIGADVRIIEHAIGTMYAEDERKTEFVKDYVEKVIQVPYYIPWLSPSEVETYISLLFCKKLSKPEVFKKCLDAFREFRKTNLRETFAYARIKNILTSEEFGVIEPMLGFCDQAASLITQGLKGNPRQIKRFLNAYVLRKMLANGAGLVSIKDDILIKLMILEYASFERFKELFAWQASQKGVPKELEAIEAQKESPEQNGVSVPLLWNTKEIIRWANMKPKLVGLDISDYFWIARDKLASTISDAALVPPVVRKVLDGLFSGRRPEIEASRDLCTNLEHQDLTMVLDRLMKSAHMSPEGPAMLALFELCAIGIKGTDDYLVEALMQADSKKIPAKLGPQLKTMIRADTKLNDKFKKVLEKHATIHTAFGRAISGDIPTKTQGGRHGHIS